MLDKAGMLTYPDAWNCHDYREAHNRADTYIRRRYRDYPRFPPCPADVDCRVTESTHGQKPLVHQLEPDDS